MIGSMPAMAEATRVGLSAVALSAGLALLTGLAALLATSAVARRSTAAAGWLAPLLVVVIVAVGVLVSARAMLLQPDQVLLLTAVLAVSAAIAVGFGVVLARRIRGAEEAHARADAERARDAAIEAKRQELVRWISHDLRTPLGRLRAIAEALRDGLAPDPEAALAQLDTEAEAMAGLIDDLLVLSRLTSDEAPLDLEPVDLADVLSDTVAAATIQAAAAGVELVGGCDPGLVVAADLTELNRALGNLVDNALRHTGAGGTVAVHGTGVPGGSGARIRVMDGCGGIPEADLPRVFDPGWRGDSARTPGSGASSGLGLAIAANVVHRHGGTIAVANHGQGCAFTIDLPAEGPGAGR